MTSTPQSFGRSQLTDQRVHQALLGYGKGHQLLASSVELDVAATRLLRTATDMAFDGRSESYLSVFPLPDADLHAFVRSWGGSSWQRAGAVWSHAIFLDPIQLSRVGDLASIARMFRRPKADSAAELGNELSAYASVLTWHTSAAFDRPRVQAFDESLAATVIGEFYDSQDRVEIGVGGREGIDDLVLALLSQQWPSLRRTFSARTRARSSDASWQVGLEIVDRPKMHDSTAPPEWARFLARDMQAPSRDFRVFLGRYGAESRSGRLAMPPLVTLYRLSSSQTSSPMRLVKDIRLRYPNPAQMRLLKRDLVGKTGSWTPPSWPTTETDRLTLAFSLGSAADFADLDLGNRLTDLLLESPLDDRAREIPLTYLAPEQVELLLHSIAEKLDVDRAVPLAIAHPDLGLLIAARKPQVLERSEVWEAVDSDLAVTVFEGLPAIEQKAILERLLETGATRPLLSICERLPDAWWSLLFSSSEVPFDAIDGLVDRARTLRAVLDRIGSAAINLPSQAVRSPSQALLIMLSADLSAGLWRRCSPLTWQQLASAIDSVSSATNDLPDYVRDRVHAVALLTAGTSAVAADRTNGWKRSFGYLHERLKRASFDGEAWRVLANTLPSGSADWDRCERLRRGLTAEIRRDKWSTENIALVVKAAGDSGSDISSRVAPPEPARKKNILEQFIDHLFS